jgi:hypothetical protein
MGDRHLDRRVRFVRQLRSLVGGADAGFDRKLFAAMLGRIDRGDDEDFIEYGVGHEHVAGLRQRPGLAHQPRRGLTDSGGLSGPAADAIGVAARSG